MTLKTDLECNGKECPRAALPIHFSTFQNYTTAGLHGLREEIKATNGDTFSFV